MSWQGALSSTQVAQQRATALPDVVLKEGADWTNITFKGKGFAWVDHAENTAMIKTHHEERDALLATSPAVYEAGWATNSTAWVRVQLDVADPEEVLELLEEAWRRPQRSGQSGPSTSPAGADQHPRMAARLAAAQRMTESTHPRRLAPPGSPAEAGGVSSLGA